MELTGVFVPLITPFDAHGDVATGALERLAHEVLDDGATGLVALGTTGEPASLTDRERALVTDIAARVCRERGVPLIVGAGGPAVGDAALVLVPPFTRPGVAGALAHLRATAAESPVPVVVYHVPQRTAQDLPAAALLDLAAAPNVIGMKYAKPAIDADTTAFMADAPADFSVLGGDDATLSPLLALGARGGVVASAHVATAAFADLVALWHKGDAAEARALGHRLAPLSSALFAEPNPVVLKGVLHALRRIPTPDVRLPLLAASPENVAAALARVG